MRRTALSQWAARGAVIGTSVVVAWLGACRPATEPVVVADLVPNQRTPLESVVSGGQPTSEQLAAAAAAGYKTVINLRTSGEKGAESEEQVAELGMSYVALPIAGAAGLTEDNARAFAAQLERAERPVLVHCGSGNRVGALFALKAFYVDGASAADALEIGLAAGLTGLEDAVREQLATSHSPR